MSTMYLFEKKMLCATAWERIFSAGLATGCEPGTVAEAGLPE